MYCTEISTSVTSELKKMGKDERLDAGRFNMFAQTHHNLLYPAWHMQDLLQSAIVNTSFWQKKMMQRKEWSHGTYNSLARILGHKHLASERYNCFVVLLEERGLVYL
jgi:hypothetical protein